MAVVDGFENDPTVLEADAHSHKKKHTQIVVQSSQKRQQEVRRRIQITRKLNKAVDSMGTFHCGRESRLNFLG